VAVRINIFKNEYSKPLPAVWRDSYKYEYWRTASKLDGSIIT
jgi:hypothetical protein